MILDLFQVGNDCQLFALLPPEIHAPHKYRKIYLANLVSMKLIYHINNYNFLGNCYLEYYYSVDAVGRGKIHRNNWILEILLPQRYKISSGQNDRDLHYGTTRDEI